MIDADAITHRIVLMIGLAGAACFSLLLALSCLTPATIETWARQAITAEVRLRADAYAPSFGDLARLRAVARLIKKPAEAPAGAAQSPLAKLKSAYTETAQALIREVRIFSAANGFVFLLLALMAYCWKRDGKQLLAPAIVLVGAALIVGYMYAFNQDWLQTILLGNYVGLWYFPYLLVAATFMLDVVYNRGRISQLIALPVIELAGAAIVAVVAAIG